MHWMKILGEGKKAIANEINEGLSDAETGQTLQQ